MALDESIRRTLQFFATFVQENPMPPKQVAELLMKADAEIAGLTEANAMSGRQLAAMTRERDMLLTANEAMLAKCKRYEASLGQIAINISSEPYAASYAQDTLDGKVTA